MSTGHRASTALMHLGEIDPALSVLALWSVHSDGAEATQTSGNRIAYGPEFMSFTLAEQVGAVAHHVLHVALQHSERYSVIRERLGEDFDADLFGLAADSIINETLLQAGHGIPRPAVVLTELLEEIGDPAPGPVAALSEWDTEALAMHLHANRERRGKASKYQKRKAFSNDVSPESAKSGEGTERSRLDWRNHMVRAMEAGRRAGVGIGRLGTILADLAPPEIPWEVRLRGLLSKALSQFPEPHHKRPAARWIAASEDARRHKRAAPGYVPGLARSVSRSRVVVGLDTSSSIDEAILKMFFSEALGVSRRAGAETYLLAFDEEVHFQTALSVHQSPFSGWSVRVGGGTNFAPLIEEAEKLDPSILVIMSDGDGPSGRPPKYPVLWAVPGNAPVELPFGAMLRLR